LSMWYHGEHDMTRHSLPFLYLLYVCSDNCKIGLYCDTNTTTCIQQRSVGGSCAADKECTTFNCLPNQVCGASPSSPRQFPTWVYIIIGTGIFGGKDERWATHTPCSPHSTHNITLGTFGTLVILFFVHRRQREDEREKRLQYWREQVKRFSFFPQANAPTLHFHTCRTLSVKTLCRCTKQHRLPYS